MHFHTPDTRGTGKYDINDVRVLQPEPFFMKMNNFFVTSRLREMPKTLKTSTLLYDPSTQLVERAYVA